MRLYFHKDPLGNFGDDLNPWLFEALMPGMFRGHCYHDPALRESGDDEGPLFVGIGTLLNDRIPKRAQKAVFGSGAGYGPASTIDDRWTVYCVRGPITADLLGLPREQAITDAAALLTRVALPKPGKTARYAFMPHCATARAGSWDLVCADLDILYIDPQSTVEDILTAIQATDTLITEAMHGAIIADSLRIPFVPVTTTSGVLDVKWRDWCASLDMDYRPSRLPSLWKRDGVAGLAGKTKDLAKFHLAKQALRRVLRKGLPTLSDEATLEARVDQLEAQLDRFKADVARGRYAGCRADI